MAAPTLNHPALAAHQGCQGMTGLPAPTGAEVTLRAVLAGTISEMDSSAQDPVPPNLFSSPWRSLGTAELLRLTAHLHCPHLHKARHADPQPCNTWRAHQGHISWKNKGPLGSTVCAVSPSCHPGSSSHLYKNFLLANRTRRCLWSKK